MEASEAPPTKCTTDEILTTLGINTQGARNGIQENMLMEPKGIGHLNDGDAEGTQVACGGHTKRTLVNVIFIVTRVKQKLLVLLMYWDKDLCQLR